VARRRIWRPSFPSLCPTKRGRATQSSDTYTHPHPCIIVLINFIIISEIYVHKMLIYFVRRNAKKEGEREIKYKRANVSSEWERERERERERGCTRGRVCARETAAKTDRITVKVWIGYACVTHRVRIARVRFVLVHTYACVTGEAVYACAISRARMAPGEK